MANTEISSLREHLGAGQVVPALPLALNEDRRWSKRHQQALIRYYLESGAGGLAVGVHSTQFEIRDPEHALFEAVLEFAAEVLDRFGDGGSTFARIAGICGKTDQAMKEVSFARAMNYDAGLLGLAAMGDADDDELIRHCREVAEVIPVIGFYLQPAIGGRNYSYDFWRAFAEIPNVVAIKIAPFDRYATLDVVRAVADSGREDLHLYTGNDDNIIADLLAPFSFNGKSQRIVGGLLGQWAVGTRRAVQLLKTIQENPDDYTTGEWLALNASLTDLNSALFDPGNHFQGCLSGMNEMLRQDGLVPSNVCLSEHEKLSSGQAEELQRVRDAYPEWQDSEFITANLERWLSE